MFNSPNDFSVHIEKMAYEENLSLADAILAYCDEHSLEPNDIKDMVSSSLKDKLAVEFRALGMLPALATLEDV